MLHGFEFLQWVVQGGIDVDIGANPSAEGGDDEGVDDQVVKVVDIVDTFRLQVAPSLLHYKPYLLFFSCFLLCLVITIASTCRNNLLSTRSSLLHSSNAT
jgi:hypothetical protein